MEAESDSRIKISDAVGKFLHDLDGIKSAEEIACSLIQVLAKQSGDKYEKLLVEFGTETDEESEESTILVPVERDKEFRDAQRQRNLTNSAIYQTPRALLVAMVSSFDAYLGRLLRCVFYLRPERIDSSERTLTFSQLVSLDSIDAAREHVISKEIETFLRKSHVEHFDVLEKLLDMPLRKGLDSWPRFVEVTQRRNLFVHSDGVVSEQYVAICQENKVNLGDTKVGDHLFLDHSYFRDAFECLYEIGVKLAHVIWRKLSPDQLEESDASLNQVCYELLQFRRFRLAHNILHFATEDLKKHNSALNRRMLIVNRAIAAKFGKIESDPSPLELEDWSDCGLPFRLALAVLSDQFDLACDIMRQLGTEHELVNRKAYGNWPLFLEFRKNDGFLETYRDLFGAEFNVSKTPDQPDQNTDQPYADGSDEKGVTDS
ncbi:hypothetical protein [Rubripirellula reticaptiva]|uniref:Uncharacterized protein n=1 Tax=Rubripirellula reticaptiva TaxID=2528013 RepID=A0A5C6E6R4_9BACT|nr:hypothetical protein [Rubripirellula reticaptiva]TWU44490.1 hypothetical protein Poly59_61440 [Rubripirellula reticaptiva]